MRPLSGAAALKRDVNAVLFWDGAGFQTANALEVPSNISIEKLPPRSPELMPVENLWHYEREHYWSNRKYADYTALEAAARDGWRTVCLDPAKIKSICAVPYQKSAGLSGKRIRTTLNLARSSGRSA